MKKFFLFAATLLGLVACNKNEVGVNAPARQITIHATANVNNGSAASSPHRIAPNDITASSVSFHWQEGDKVWVLSNDFSEKQIFTIDNSSINDNQANFTGTALSDMSSYYVIYLDNMVSEETLMASISAEDPVTYNYNPDSKNWFFVGQGQEDNFTLGCDLTIRMQLKGSCKLSKVTLLWMDNDEPEGYDPATTTINFVHGSYDGLQLTSTPVEVVMPLSITTVYGFTLRFYDTDGNLIMEKSKEGSSLYNDFDNYGLVNLGVLEVKFTPTYVDLGLPSGLKWATCNVGATAPEGYGAYFAWGETSPKEVYDWSTYFDSNDGETFTKYYLSGGKTTLDLEDDAAHVNWGGNWRMPTKEEQDELRNTNNCTWVWQENYNSAGVNGYLVKSKKEGYTDNSIFLPVSGYRDGSSLNNVGSYGYYWSSSLSKVYSYRAYYLKFYLDIVGYSGDYRYYGYSVRPVCSIYE